MIENEYILERKGETKTQNLLDECSKEFQENFTKRFPDYKDQIHAHSIVSVTEENEIKDIGISCMNDLLTDNFGIWFGAFLAGRPTIVSMKNFTNASVNCGISTNLYNYNNTDGISTGEFIGTYIGIGQGTTPATRQDFNIESFFATPPENVRLPCGSGGWNSGLGKVDIPMIPIGAGGSGAISETCFFQSWHSEVSLNNQIYCLARDNISPVVNFVIGQTINVDYSLILG